MADDAPTSTVVAADVAAAGAAAVQDAPAKDAVASPCADNTSRKGESVAAATTAAAVAEKNKAGDAPTAAVGGDSAEAPSKSNGGVASRSDENVADAADAAVATTVATVATANDGASAATPATSAAKKSGKVSRRKSAVNLKKTPSKSNPADQRFKEGDQVLAKMRSFPPWPAVVLSRELLPGIMVGDAAQKGTTKSLDSVGPAAWVTQYPIFYLGTYEYSWMSVTDLDPLTQDKIDAGAAGKKTKRLIEAFQEAKKGFSLKDVKEIQENVMEFEEEPVLEPEPEGDKMDIDEEEREGEPASDSDKLRKKATRGKKRKKSETASDDEAEAESEKPAKTPKKAPAAKTKTPKAAAAAAAAATPAAKTPKTPKTPANGVKASAKKAAAAATTTTTTATPATATTATATATNPTTTMAKEKATTPASTKGKKSATPATKGKRGSRSKGTADSESEGSAPEARAFKDVRGMSEDDQHKAMLHRRHRLQKAFLNKDQTAPNESEMGELSRCLEALESWPDMPAGLIKSTKIHKVLRGICKVDFTIPLEDKYKFKERSKVLHDKWMQVLQDAEESSEGKEGGAKEGPAKEGAAEEGDVKEGGTKEGGAKENGIDDGDDAPPAAAAAPTTNGDSEVKAAGADTTEAATVKEAGKRGASVSVDKENVGETAAAAAAAAAAAGTKEA